LPTSGSGCSKIVGQQKLPGGLLGGHGFLKLALSEEHSQKLAIQRGFNGASAAETRRSRANAYLHGQTWRRRGVLFHAIVDGMSRVIVDTSVHGWLDGTGSLCG
jgi:hypothetical protein